MTKTLEALNRFNEHFPSQILVEERYSPIASRRRSSCPASPTILGKFSVDIPSLGKELLLENHRRHSTEQCLLAIPKSPLNNKKTYNLLSGTSDSRRSSGSSSIPEVITECDSDEESSSNNKTHDNGFDYIRCINCSRSNDSNNNGKSKSTSELHIQQQIINYCYNCRHLNNNPHLPAFYEGRRSSWTAGETLTTSSQSPRNSRRTSLATASSCTELPIISEPSFDDETNDTAELKLIVEEEVDKLTKLNNRKNKQQQKQQQNTLEKNCLLERKGFLPEVKNTNCKPLLVTLRETNI